MVTNKYKHVINPIPIIIPKGMFFFAFFVLWVILVIVKNPSKVNKIGGKANNNVVLLEELVPNNVSAGLKPPSWDVKNIPPKAAMKRGTNFKIVDILIKVTDPFSRYIFIKNIPRGITNMATIAPPNVGLLSNACTKKL